MNDRGAATEPIADQETKADYRLGKTTTLLDLFRAFPVENRHLLEYHEALLRGPSELAVPERELIAAYVSGLNRCDFCCSIHTAVAERLGSPVGLIGRLLTDESLSAAPDKIAPLLRYAKALTRMDIDAATGAIESIRAAGWGDETIYQTAAIVGLFNLMNRLVTGLGIRLGTAYREAATDRLATLGYMGVASQLAGS